MDFKVFEQFPEYDVAGGVTEFPALRIESKDAVTVQVFYEGLDAEDLIINVQQSLELADAPDFNNVVDPAGNNVEQELISADTSHTFNVTGFETDLARLVISAIGGVTIGTITKILWRVQK